jgi:hypothetical protein
MTSGLSSSRRRQVVKGDIIIFSAKSRTSSPPVTGHPVWLATPSGLRGLSTFATPTGLCGTVTGHPAWLATPSGLRGLSTFATPTGLRGPTTLATPTGLRGLSTVATPTGLRGLLSLSARQLIIIISSRGWRSREGCGSRRGGSWSRPAVGSPRPAGRRSGPEGKQDETERIGQYEWKLFLLDWIRCTGQFKNTLIVHIKININRDITYSINM